MQEQTDIFLDNTDGFKATAAILTKREQQTIARAIKILERVMREGGEAMTSPAAVVNYMKLNLAMKPHEVFLVMFLNNQHQLLEAKEMFRGTINQASVYPREIVKEALQLNAAAVILAHNHPSGVAEPSRSDIEITKKIKEALELVEVRTLDHLIIGGGGKQYMSFVERCLVL